VILAGLRRRLLCRPRLWLLLLIWPLVALLLILAPSGILQSGSAVHGAALTVVAVSAVASLILLALIARRFYSGIRELRAKLFAGDYEGALDLARRNLAVGHALGFESALVRMLEFDARRADKVAAAARLFSSFLHEVGVPFFIADLDDDLLYLSRPARQLFAVNVERLSLLAVLLLPANREFSRLYNSVAKGEQASAEATLPIHLPVRQAVRRLDVRMLAVQDDEGMVLYVLGFLAPPANEAAPPPPNRP